MSGTSPWAHAPAVQGGRAALIISSSWSTRAGPWASIRWTRVSGRGAPLVWISPSRDGVRLSAICHLLHGVSACGLAELRQYVRKHVPHFGSGRSFLLHLCHGPSRDGSRRKIGPVVDNGRGKLPVLRESQHRLHLEPGARLRLGQHEHERTTRGLNQRKRIPHGV